MSQNAAVAEPPVEKRERERNHEPGKTKPKTAKPWAVIVLNDDEHTYQYVMELLQKVFHYTVQKCFKLAEEINDTGRSVVWSGSQEVAELKRDQIKGGGQDFHAEAGPVKWPLGCYIEEMP